MLAPSSCAAAPFVPHSQLGQVSRDEAAGHARLWRMVLSRVLLDAFGFDLGNDGRKQRQATIDRARTWLSQPTPDRDTVLDLAGFAPGDLDRCLDQLRRMWALADAGTLPPEATGRVAPKPCFGRDAGQKCWSSVLL